MPDNNVHSQKISKKTGGISAGLCFFLLLALLLAFICYFLGPLTNFFCQQPNNIVNIVAALVDYSAGFFLFILFVALLPQKFQAPIRKPLVLKVLSVLVVIAVLRVVVSFFPAALGLKYGMSYTGNENISSLQHILTGSALVFFALMTCCLGLVSSWTKKLRQKNPSSMRGSLLSLLRLEFTHSMLSIFYVLFIGTLVCYPGSIGDWVSNWLIASARDANFTVDPEEFNRSRQADLSYLKQQPAFAPVLAPVGGGRNDPKQEDDFAAEVKAILSLALLAVSFSWARRVIQLLTIFVQRFSLRPEAGRLQEAFIEATQTNWKRAELKEEHPLPANCMRTVWWFIICFLLIFLGITIAPGKIGMGLINWLDASLIDAGFKGLSILDSVQLRAFVASVVAMYGAVPLAVTLCAFLPHRRLPELAISREALVLPSGIRRLRAWSDLKSVELKGKNKDYRKRKLLLKFRSSGQASISLASLSDGELCEILAQIDEFADSCSFSAELLALRKDLSAQDGARAEKFSRADQNKLNSTIFVPHAGGHEIESHKLRIVRQLTGKSLTAGYLVRRQENLMILKQFVLPSDTDNNSRLKEKFLREYELLKSLDHPCISKIVEVFEEAASSYLLIEYARGQDLNSLVKRLGPRSQETVIDWSIQICRILSYLHNQQEAIIHRDLTPDNIVLSDEGQIRIIDFGAAQQFIEGVTGTLIGKQCYVAAEQLRGKAGVCSDIYSLGCTMYFLLTGCDPLPLSECNAEEHVKVSPWLNELIKKCTAFEEADRPQSAEAVLQILLNRGLPAEGSCESGNTAGARTEMHRQTDSTQNSEAATKQIELQSHSIIELSKKDAETIQISGIENVEVLIKEND